MLRCVQLGRWRQQCLRRSKLSLVNIKSHHCLAQKTSQLSVRQPGPVVISAYWNAGPDLSPHRTNNSAPLNEPRTPDGLSRQLMFWGIRAHTNPTRACPSWCVAKLASCVGAPSWGLNSGNNRRDSNEVEGFTTALEPLRAACCGRSMACTARPRIDGSHRGGCPWYKTA